MSDSKKEDSKTSSDVSRFKVDGVVAEMVIVVDEENESQRTSFTESNLGKGKDSFDAADTSDDIVAAEATNNKTEVVKDKLKSNVNSQDGASLKDRRAKMSKAEDNKKEKVEGKGTDELILKRGRSSKRKLEESEENSNSNSAKKAGTTRRGETEKVNSTNRNEKAVSAETEESKGNSIIGKRKLEKGEVNNTENLTKRFVGRPKLIETVTVESPVRKSGRQKRSSSIQENSEDANKSIDTRKNNLKKSSSRQIVAKSDVTTTETKVIESKRTSGLGKGLYLGDIPGLSTRLKLAPKNVLRLLYRTIYNQWPSFTNMDKLMSDLQNFNGFPFDKNSAEFDKRKKLLLSFVDSHIGLLRKMLGLKAGPKSAMVAHILNFFIKPNLKICETDKSLQPFVKLERISLDDAYLLKSQRNNVKGTRSSTVKESKNSNVKESRNSNVKESRNSTVTESRNSHVRATPASTRKAKAAFKTAPVKESLNQSTGTPSSQEKLSSESEENEVTEIKDEVLSDADESPVIRESSAVLKSSLSSPKFSDTSENGIIETDSVKTEKTIDAEKKICCLYHGPEEEISEETLSSEETAAQKKKAVVSPPKKHLMQNIQRPLVMFPKIKESIKFADLQPLQRLHILLFGASEKPELLRHNILAFGGFPFREGSEDWKQKEFLLSLLAPNTLKEYLKILCIDFGEEDQQSVLISKLMQFLSAPGGRTVVTQVTSANLGSKTKVVSKEVVTKEIKKKPKKVEKLKKGNRHRKVLMDETQVRRLEADIAREQRILAREKKSEEMRRRSLGILGFGSPNVNSFTIGTSPTVAKPVTPVTPANKEQLIMSNNVVIGRRLPSSVTDVNLSQVNALLQTVYKRRALKEAGVLVSVPNQGTPTKLGDLENVKFMVVTANYNDLDILHHLIFMMDATKAKVRKNILEFSGFGFDEDSVKYKKRMDFLNSLGYDISKRIAFLLGLSSFQTKISQQDLNELIMYFLMSPSKIKHAPIKDMPQDFFRETTKDMNLLIFKPIGTSQPVATKQTAPKAKAKKMAVPQSPRTTPKSQTSKVFSQSHPTPPKSQAPKVLSQSHTATPTSQTSKVFSQSSTTVPKTASTASPSSITNQPIVTPGGLKLFPVQKVVMPSHSLLNKSEATISTPTPVPLQSLPQFILQQPVQNNSAIPSSILPNTQIILEPIVNHPGLKTVTSATGAPEQLIVQQQPEGGGPPKMFKLIKLPPNHPLAAAIGNKTQLMNTQQNSEVQMKLGPPVIRVPQQGPVLTNPSGNILPPGIILFKKDIMGMQAAVKNTSSVLSQPIVSANDEFVLPNEGEAQSDYWSNDEEVEVLHPLESNPPTDGELFESIQEIIHNSNFEDITLRNVIDKVSAQYSDTDLTQKHNFMKECVKRIIIGTS